MGWVLLLSLVRRDLEIRRRYICQHPVSLVNESTTDDGGAFDMRDQRNSACQISTAHRCTANDAFKPRFCDSHLSFLSIVIWSWAYKCSHYLGPCDGWTRHCQRKPVFATAVSLQLACHRIYFYSYILGTCALMFIDRQYGRCLCAIPSPA